MKKIKYYYNTNTLRYEKLETPLRVKLLRIFGFIAAALVTAALISYFAFQFIGSPKERILQDQNKALRDNYNELENALKSISNKCWSWKKRDNDVYRAIFEASPIPDSARAKRNGKQAWDSHGKKKLKMMKLTASITKTLNDLNNRISSQKKSYDQVDETRKKIKNNYYLIRLRFSRSVIKTWAGLLPVSDPGSILFIKRSNFTMDLISPRHRVRRSMQLPTARLLRQVKPVTGTGTMSLSIMVTGMKHYMDIWYVWKFSNGQAVKRGQLIGWVGSTGKSTGPHCHYEVHKNGEKIDPIYFFYKRSLPRRSFDQLLKKSGCFEPKSWLTSPPIDISLLNKNFHENPPLLKERGFFG